MKKFFTLAAVATMALSANAQLIRFGLRAGANISSESSPSSPSMLGIALPTPSFTGGFNVGAIMNVALINKLELEADLLYSMQGCKDRIEVIDLGIPSGYGEDVSVTSHYLNIPIVAKYHILGNFYLQAGPQLGVLLSKDSYWTATDAIKNRSFDASLVFGVGYKFFNKILLDARYIHGLSDTYNWGNTTFEGAKNRNIQLSVGYLF